MLRNPALINFLDGGALSLPCHAPGAAPVGLTLAGSGEQDARVLAVVGPSKRCWRGSAPEHGG